MRLLDRYLFRELLIPFAYILAGFFIFWLSVDLINNLSDYQKAGLQAVDVVDYYFFKVPEILVLMLPVTLLLSLLYALTNHARHHELTAMRAAGVSLMRLSIPYFAVGLFLSLALFVLNEFFVPRAAEEMESVMTRYETNEVQNYSADWELKFGFKNARERRTWYIEAFNRETGDMVGPRVYYVGNDGFRYDVSAAGATFEEGHWIFTNVQEFVYPPQAGAEPTYIRNDARVMTDLTETPEQINIQIKISRIEDFRKARKAQLSIRDILLYKKMHPNDDQKDTLLHGRMAAPFTCLVVVLIALPFGAASGRRNVFVGVASSIVICFGFFVCQQLGLALGYGGKMPAWLAGWLPNLVFATWGAVLTWRIR